MRIVFSRKGFDSQAGGAASPIVAGRPISLPIPTDKAARSRTTFDGLNVDGIDYGKLVERATGGKIARDRLCHEDPMFDGGGRCLFGQCGAAQSHLANHGIGKGDAFLFFGLFAGPDKHHRIFGYLEVEHIFQAPIASDPLQRTGAFAREHPHALGEWPTNNTVYAGRGATARSADDRLRMTQRGGPVSAWVVPGWLKETGLTFHGKDERWLADGRLRLAARGQEFVADVGERPDARQWLRQIIESIEA